MQTRFDTLSQGRAQAESPPAATQEERECDAMLAVAKIKLMKLPINKREEMLDKIVNMLGQAVRDQQGPQTTSIGGGFPIPANTISVPAAYNPGINLPLAATGNMGATSTFTPAFNFPSNPLVPGGNFQQHYRPPQPVLPQQPYPQQAIPTQIPSVSQQPATPGQYEFTASPSSFLAVTTSPNSTLARPSALVSNPATPDSVDTVTSFARALPSQLLSTQAGPSDSNAHSTVTTTTNSQDVGTPTYSYI